MEALKLGHPLQMAFCLLTLSEGPMLASITPLLALLIQFLSAISLSLLIAINAKKLFSANSNVQKSQTERD
jgi:hypothetical protein